MQLSPSLLLLALLNSVHAATVLAPAPEPTQFITLDIVNGPVAPDGFTRIGVLANGTFPGPPIVATKGQTLVVKVNNKLTDNTMRRSTTMNFDGVFIDSDNVFNEGSPFVTTCPFGPGESYTYTLPLGDQTGTFWYHSQLSVQYADGLRGTLIVYDPDDPLAHLYDVDDASTVLTVADWWHNTSTSGLAGYIATQIIPVSDSGLFNARGRYNSGPEVEYAAVSVVKGKRYRFRLINMSARANFVVSIDNHTMTIIEADGVATEPNEVNILTIYPGQRYSFVVTANKAVGNYWINAFINSGNAAHNLNLNSTLSRGILRYVGAQDEEPQTPMTAGPTGPDAVMLNEWELVPLDPIPAPEPDFNLTFNTFMPVDLTEWEINNSSYIPPTVPTLVKVLQGETQQSDFNKTENTFLFPANKTVQVEIIDATNEGHPFHLHGMNFWVVKANGTDIINTVNPIRRDVSITGNGNLTVRFRTDKPGPWFFHCHIFYHFVVGLGSVIGAGLDEVAKTVHPTEAWERLCPAYDALPPSEQ
ncbi:Cu-oxidase-domain-containing protein [Mycena alexandri]|uniref:Cu-oxidase-domain-containing protein n=1 Tax=Mycena alexandri TaxID=1745969 RepID=A0AAD6T8X6_9AGAR|nr:Cu-oxidase-domain-containing protein [Mycena alexandri]